MTLFRKPNPFYSTEPAGGGTTPEPTPTPTEPTNGGQTEPPKTEPTNTVPYDRFKEKVEEVNSFKSVLKELGFDNVDNLKTSFQDFKSLQDKEDERKRAEKTDFENLQTDYQKAQEKINELTQNYESLLSQNKEEKIQSSFKEKIKEKGVPNEYLNAAIKLADLSEVKFEGGKVEGIDSIIEKLVTENPFLTQKVDNQPNPIGSSTNPKTQTDNKTAEEVLKEYADKARKSGRHEDMVAYMKKKKELGK